MVFELMCFFILFVVVSLFSVTGEERSTFIGTKSSLLSVSWYSLVSFLVTTLLLLLFCSVLLQLFGFSEAAWVLHHDNLHMLDLAFIGYDSYNTASNFSFLLACFITTSFFFTMLLGRPGLLTNTCYIYLFALTLISILFIFTSSIALIFIYFECLLLLAIGLLKLTSKSERIGEAVSEMFMWTLFGSFFLLLGFFSLYSENFVYLSYYQHNPVTAYASTLFFVVGFGVKIPLWPFFSWLLKAHVEASVEFSILLSGFIVKLGVLGLWRILDFFGADWLYTLVVGISVLAILDATLRLFTQIDLKRIVALTTVIEMNWLNISYVLGDANLVFIAHYLVVVHCFTTASEFLLVEFVSKRYGTRNFLTDLWFVV